MYISLKKHKVETDRFSAQLREQDGQIDALKRQVAELEKTRHEIVEKTRYALEAAEVCMDPPGRFTGGGDVFPMDDFQLKGLAEALPYLLSGTRRWGEASPPGAADERREKSVQLAAAHGFALPADPVDAVKAMLDLASMLFCPAFKIPVEGLRTYYPLPASESTTSIALAATA